MLINYALNYYYSDIHLVDEPLNLVLRREESKLHCIISHLRNTYDILLSSSKPIGVE